MVRANLQGLEPETTYKLQIRTYGQIKPDCAAGGDEFNPLKEVKYGVTNPHADPTRGRINAFTSAADGTATLEQKSLLQNLSGKESLIGKQLTLMKVGEDGTTMDVGCCAIGSDKLPAHLEKKQKGYNAFVPAYSPYGSKSPDKHIKRAVSRERKAQ